MSIMLKEKQPENKITGMVTLAVLVAVMIVMGVFVLSSALPGMSVTDDIGGQRGIVDLRTQSGFDYETDMFLLNGEWEYYPNSLLFPEDFAGGELPTKRYVQFPHYFRNDPVNFPDGRGFATYRIVILAPPDAYGVGIFNEFQYGAYRIFLDGQEITKGGAVSENTGEHFFAYNGGSGYIRSESGEFEIIVQVQCQGHVNGGLNNNIIIGAPAPIAHYRAF
ncbi:MAG: hypothetical protein LBC86_04130, partial [Oscillospiraceae bacterium]|nr:hypothetical protein [Oscillospiraceae bacterium]